MAPRKQYDWEAIEREYRLGQKSLRMLSKEFGPSPGTISKRANRPGEEWVQDKSTEVREKTRAALIKETPEGNTQGNTPTREDIDRAVQTNVGLIREHRRDIGNGRALVELLAGQLRDAAESRDQLEDDIAEDTKEDNTIQRRARMMKAVSLPAHAGVLRDLTTALKNLIPLERQAFSLDDGDGGDNPLKSLLEKVSGNQKPLVGDDD